VPTPIPTGTYELALFSKATANASLMRLHKRHDATYVRSDTQQHQSLTVRVFYKKGLILIIM
jgi:hypothetical protein